MWVFPDPLGVMLIGSCSSFLCGLSSTLMGYNADWFMFFLLMWVFPDPHGVMLIGSLVSYVGFPNPHGLMLIGSLVSYVGFPDPHRVMLIGSLVSYVGFSRPSWGSADWSSCVLRGVFPTLMG